MRLDGRVAVVTGGARGIGAATASVFAELGAHVLVADVLDTEGQAVVDAILRSGGEAGFVRCDVTEEGDCARLMRTACERYGHLDTLVCCAGILRGSYTPLEELDEATFRSVIDVNLVGTYLCVRQAIPHMRERGSGVVLLIASGAGVRGGSSSFAYGASKGGVHGLFLTLEARLASLGIRVHDICPGVIDTQMMRSVVVAGAQASGRPEDAALASTAFGDPRGVARVLAFLASSDADYVRGTIYTR